MKNNKSLGQHWLKNRVILDYIADSARTTETSFVLEIGPGLGTLTSSLLKRFDKVIAVEYDERLAENLPKSFPGTNLEVINGDFLDFDLDNIKEPYVAVGNIPYYITSPIITKLLTAEHPPAKIVLLIQKEVAERISAPAGKHTYLSLFVQNFASVTLGDIIPRTEFTPPPKVDSQVIILTPHAPVIDDKTLAFAKIGFSQPRKKLSAVLAASYHLSKPEARETLIRANLSPDARPADLSHRDWQNLQKTLSKTLAK